jgi:hypothetical protein
VPDRRLSQRCPFRGVLSATSPRVRDFLSKGETAPVAAKEIQNAKSDRNPKPETRNPIEGRNGQTRTYACRSSSGFGFSSSFGFQSSFGFPISSFPAPPHPALSPRRRRGNGHGNSGFGFDSGFGFRVSGITALLRSAFSLDSLSAMGILAWAPRNRDAHPSTSRNRISTGSDYAPQGSPRRHGHA